MRAEVQNNPQYAPRCALVVFGDRADLPWLKILKRGYRHCFVLIEGQVHGREAHKGEGGFWVVYNPLSHCTELGIVAGLDTPAITTHYRALGHRVLQTRVTHPPKRCAPWRPYTCVEAVKRVLGLRAPGVFTPWQLFQAVNRKIIL